MQASAGVPDEPSRHYVAFVSYSHRDRKWAEWLHRSIENYRVPRDYSARAATLGDAQPSLRPVFLDREELPTSPDLAQTVRAALQQSRFLIVVCSPDGARSRWVNEEVRIFKEAGHADRILCVIVGGDPAAASGTPADCYPPAMRLRARAGHLTDEPDVEPLAADLRPGRDDRRAALLRIVAGILGVPLDHLRHREQSRRHRRMAWIAATSTIGCVGLGALSAYALYARADAVRQRRVAEQQSLTARRTTEFLKSLFVVSDPSEARGNTITAREVLDRGARQIATQLKDEPLVRADLATTLGEVYAGLGLLRDGEQLLQQAGSAAGQSPELAARQAVALGEVRYQRGDYSAALEQLVRAEALLRPSTSSTPQLAARLQIALGDVYIRREELGESRAQFQRALATAAQIAEDRGELRARALAGIAQADAYDGQLEQAAAELRAALAARLALSGELHPRTADILSDIGSVEYLQGHAAAAASYYRRALEVDRRVLGVQHPDYASTLSNLARVQLERRRFAEAHALLTESMNARATQVVATEDDMAFVYSNLALADIGLGELRAAEQLFHKALAAAIANRHRLHGPILTDLADVECRTGRYRAGLARLEEARPIVAARYPDDAWRSAHLDNVRAGCLAGMARGAEAARLMTASLAVVLKKWPPDSLYGHDALQRAVRVYALAGDEARRGESATLLAAASGAATRP